MPRKSRKNVGLIGLGIIGARVAQGLRSAGFHVFVWNRTAKPAPNFLGSPAEIAEVCDVIQLFVADGTALKAIIEAFGGALTSNHVIVCSGTVGPEATLESAAMVKEKGARFLDAPFTGSKLAAEKRQLVYYIGGDDATYKKAEPILKAVSRSIVRCGAIGHAAVLKVATNMITAVSVQTLAEALALVTKAGLSPETFGAALEHNACRSGVVDLKLPKMIAGDYEPHFSLKHMFKDVQLAIQMANALDIEAPATTVTAGVMFGALNSGWADLDYASLFKLYDASLASRPAELIGREAPASAAEILLETAPGKRETDEEKPPLVVTDPPGTDEPAKVATVEAASAHHRDAEPRTMEVVADVPPDAKPTADAVNDSASAKEGTVETDEKIAESDSPKSSRPFNRIRRFFSTAGR